MLYAERISTDIRPRRIRWRKRIQRSFEAFTKANDDTIVTREISVKIRKPIRDGSAITAYGILQGFLTHTRINWLVVFTTRKTILARVLWLCVIIACVAMALMQSWKAINAYNGYAFGLQTTFELQATLPLPSVTICANSPLNWSREETFNSSLYQEIMQRLDDSSDRLLYERKYQNKGKQYEEYVFYDSLRKIKLPDPGYGVVEGIYWNGTRYTRIGRYGGNFTILEWKGLIKRLRDFYYGECLTFNVGINEEEAIRASALTGVQFILNWDISERPPFMNDPSVVAIVHPAGTAPTLGDGNNIKIHPKDEVTVSLKQTITERLPAPYPSRCARSDDMNLRLNSSYYEPDRRYLYSIDACINSCIQRLSLSECGCFDYQLPVGALRTMFRTDVICAARCESIDSMLDTQLCRCNLPCRETSLEYTVATQARIIESLVANDFKDLDINNITTVTTLTVFLKSTMYEMVKEVPEYSTADFWGTVGGNAAFWVGASAVALFEVVELQIRLILHGLKRIFQWCESEQYTSSRNQGRKAVQKSKQPATLKSDPFVWHLSSLTHDPKTEVKKNKQDVGISRIKPIDKTLVTDFALH